MLALAVCYDTREVEVRIEPYVCPKCGAMKMEEPPHGWDQPCPMMERLADAEIAERDAQRMSSIRSASGLEGMATIMRKMTGQEEEE